MVKKYGIFFMVLLAVTAKFTMYGQVQVFPPHWFKGLQNQDLEILLYKPDGFTSLPKCKSDILKAEVSFASNHDYVYLKVQLNNFDGESFKIDCGSTTIKYQIKEAKAARPQGLNPSDAIYLITPDRFANSDSSNDRVLGMNEKKYGRDFPFGRHGGDLAGLISKLDYIQDLGFTATWSCPLLTNNEFKESYHGYAITDHYSIDPRFGTNDLFASYVKESHKRGMKVILDVVYNHFGSQHLLHLNPPDSSFFNFEMKNTRSNFRAVNLMDPHASIADKKQFSDGWFDDHMPDVNQQNPHMAAFLIQSSLWWILEYGLDAFRIDTYAYPDQEFMADLGKRIKTEFPDFFLFGEIWVHMPEIQSYFAGANRYNPNETYLDAVTDFQFKYALKESLEQHQGWTSGITKLYYRLAADYLYKNPSNLVTFIDNHDEARIFGELHQDLGKLKVALGILYTMRGIPSTYYGTEILMKETKDHGHIREDFPGGFPGDEIDKFTKEGRTDLENDAHDYIKTLLNWRKTSEAIAKGSFIHFVPENDIYVYARISESDTVLVLVNSNQNDSRELDLSRFKEVWDSKNTSVNVLNKESFTGESLSLEKMSITILQQRKGDLSQPYQWFLRQRIFLVQPRIISESNFNGYGLNYEPEFDVKSGLRPLIDSGFKAEAQQGFSSNENLKL